MKKKSLLLILLFALPLEAHIVELPGASTTPTAREVKVNRSCFQQLEDLGCGHPKDDQLHFRSCLSTVHSSLKESCKTLMNQLYGNP